MRFFFARNIGTLGNMFTIASLAQDLTVLARLTRTTRAAKVLRVELDK